MFHLAKGDSSTVPKYQAESGNIDQRPSGRAKWKTRSPLRGTAWTRERKRDEELGASLSLSLSLSGLPGPLLAVERTICHAPSGPSDPISGSIGRPGIEALSNRALSSLNKVTAGTRREFVARSCGCYRVWIFRSTAAERRKAGGSQSVRWATRDSDYRRMHAMSFPPRRREVWGREGGRGTTGRDATRSSILRPNSLSYVD